MKKHKVENHYKFQVGPGSKVVESENLPRIGLYSASFDPVHSGHIVFALKSTKNRRIGTDLLCAGTPAAAWYRTGTLCAPERDAEVGA